MLCCFDVTTFSPSVRSSGPWQDAVREYVQVTTSSPMSRCSGSFRFPLGQAKVLGYRPGMQEKYLHGGLPGGYFSSTHPGGRPSRVPRPIVNQRGGQGLTDPGSVSGQGRNLESPSLHLRRRHARDDERFTSLATRTCTKSQGQFRGALRCGHSAGCRGSTVERSVPRQREVSRRRGTRPLPHPSAKRCAGSGAPLNRTLDTAHRTLQCHERWHPEKAETQSVVPGGRRGARSPREGAPSLTGAWS